MWALGCYHLEQKPKMVICTGFKKTWNIDSSDDCYVVPLGPKTLVELCMDYILKKNYDTCNYLDSAIPTELKATIQHHFVSYYGGPP